MSKLCLQCDTKKLLIDYYKSGNGFHKYCKKCHNKNRKKYKYNTKILDGSKRGFLGLDKEIQDKMKIDIKNKVNFAQIARTYKISYDTLRWWKKKGIPL